MEPNAPENLGNQLETLHAEVRQRVESTPAEAAGGDVDRQALHQVIGERLGKTQVSAPAQSAATIPPEVQRVVESLLNKAITKDLDAAIEEVRKGVRTEREVTSAF